MTARPILFSGAMVKALLAGTKVQTRRIVKDAPVARSGFLCTQRVTYRDEAQFRSLMPQLCPHGKPGDLLWVRESWRVGKRWDSTKPRDLPVRTMTVMFGVGGSVANQDSGRYELNETYPETIPDWAGKTRPGMFMPRWASRLTLRITDVRVERLQEISEADALAEGVTMPESEHEERDESLCSQCGGTLLVNRVHGSGGMMFDCDCNDCDTAQKRYRHLWNHINGQDAWVANPWVWALTFTVEKRNVDDVLREAA